MKAQERNVVAFMVGLLLAEMNGDMLLLGETGKIMQSAKTLLGIFTIAVCLPFGQKIEAASFQPTGSMTAARFLHTATLLNNGKVLVTGGHSSPLNVANIVASAEMYDPATANWTSNGTMSAVRWMHTATLLQNGKVLVAGGDNSSADLYDPATGNWTSTSPMTTARRTHTATLLLNGKVLVTGGWSGSYRSSAELYDPATGNWTITSSMSVARGYHTATLLANGKVMLTGGSSGSIAVSSAEIYDPATGNWTSGGTMSAARHLHTATRLPNGKVLVTGGTANVASGNPALSSAEIYDTTTGNWTSAGTMSATRNLHTATMLPNGKMLVTGGHTGSSFLSSAEMYDTATGNWTSNGTMSAARDMHTATLLSNGKVLVTGGSDGSNPLSAPNAELYVPDPRVDLIKAVKPAFSGLTLTTNYQLQVSGDMNTWTNHASPFTATNTSMVYPEYWDVDNWGKLFFRLQVAP